MEKDQVQRRYDMDWLRVVSVLLLIPFHTAIIFSLNPEYVMYVKSSVEAPLLVDMAMFLGCFHMPLLFVLAGMSIYFALGKRTVKAFVKERLKKLLVPIIICVCLLNQLTTYIYQMSIGQNGSLLEYFMGMFSKPVEDFSGRNGCWTVIHLWFALYLLVFSLIGLPIFIWVRRSKGILKEKLACFFEKPFTLALLAIPFGSCYLVPLLDDKNPIAYLMLVLIGCLIASDDRYQKAMDRDKWGYLFYSVMMIGAFKIFPIAYSGNYGVDILIHLLGASRRIIPIYALLGIGHCYLNHKSTCLSYLSHASFTVYISHMLLDTAVGYVILRVSMPVGLQWLIICLITYILCFTVYEIKTKCYSYLKKIKIKSKQENVA